MRRRKKEIYLIISDIIVSNSCIHAKERTYSLLLFSKQILVLDKQETICTVSVYFFRSFSFFYILTGLILAILAFLIHTNENDDGLHINRLGQYYINAVSVYILFTSIILLIGLFCRRKIIIFFRTAIVLLIIAIILQITIVALIVFMRGSTDANGRTLTLVIISSMTFYLIILQIYGVIASLSYLSEIRHSYVEVSIK